MGHLGLLEPPQLAEGDGAGVDRLDVFGVELEHAVQVGQGVLLALGFEVHLVAEGQGVFVVGLTAPAPGPPRRARGGSPSKVR